jgi:NAD-dependent dihydropyrimidine dehydrogenase PreA subunit
MKYLNNVSTVLLDKEKCTGCGRCVEVCPRGIFILRERKAEIVDRDSCIECGACQKNCAFSAVSVSSGVGCAQALFNAMIRGGEPVCDCEKNGGDTSGCC